MGLSWRFNLLVEKKIISIVTHLGSEELSSYMPVELIEIKERL